MDTATLAQAMGNVPAVNYAALTGPCNAAMIAAGCTTINRAAMWCAQVGHESVGLRYMKELGGPAYFARYNNRRDLGNGPTDGPRFPGRGPIQLTGRHNYGRFSQWCYDRKYIGPPPTYFVNSPQLVEQPRWGFLAASWYWVVARPLLNSYADRGDLNAATRAINGGTNGWADRQTRWNRCRLMGARLLPEATATAAAVADTDGDDELKDDERAALIGIYHQMSGSPQAGKWPGWPSFIKGRPNATLLDFIRRQEEAMARLEAKVDQFIAGKQ